MSWEVHKFGGTSVASSSNYMHCQNIISSRLSQSQGSIAVVVSAMGGSPKTTDLLLDLVKEAAATALTPPSTPSTPTSPSSSSSPNPNRPPSPLQLPLVNHYSRYHYKNLNEVYQKHITCINSLNLSVQTVASLTSTISLLCDEISDILKTVQILKWAPAKIAEIVSGFGEIFSAHIFAAVMSCNNSTDNNNNDNVDVIFVDARKVIEVEEVAVLKASKDSQDNDFQKILFPQSQLKLDSLLLEHEHAPKPKRKLLVITGYIASTSSSIPTTLKRDGSDYSATIIARLLSAKSVTIWTDVSGIMSCDPRRVPSAKVLSEVSFNEAMELSYFGAKVLHPKCVQ